MTSPGGDETGIRVNCRVHPFSLLLLACKTTVNIDGASFRKRWGEHFFPCKPGDHTVHVSFRYLGEHLGDASIKVHVAPLQAVGVIYQSPPMIALFLTSREGSIRIADT